MTRGSTFSKVLHEADLPDVICQTILVAVNRVTRSDVSDVAQCFGDTIKKDAKDTKGASWIADNLEDGAATLKVIEKILGRKARIPEGTFDVTEMDLKALTPSVWTRLAESNTPIRRCLQGGIPVRAVHVPENSAKRRPTWVFQPLEADKLRNEVAQIASFHELRAKTYRQVVPHAIWFGTCSPPHQNACRSPSSHGSRMHRRWPISQARSRSRRRAWR